MERLDQVSANYFARSPIGPNSWPRQRDTPNLWSVPFNERSGGGLNRTQYPSDVIALAVLLRLRYKLSLRDLAEMFLIRGIVFTYEAVRDWEAKLTPALAEELRRSRKGKVGRSWYIDETYIRVHGQCLSPNFDRSADIDFFTVSTL